MKRNYKTRSMGIFVWAAFLVMVWTGCAGLGQSLHAPDIR
jgi:hypothetical protein